MNDNQKLKIEEAQNQLADLNETLQRKKIEVTPEVQRYIEENVRKVQGKLQEGASVYPSDLKFIEKIKIWIELEGKFTLEQIDSKQFKDLLFIAKLDGQDISWIKENFEIKGSKIVCSGSLDLEDCTGLTKLPSGLKVEGSLHLKGCTELIKLPSGLTVGGRLNLDDCTGLTKLPSGLTVGENLNLRGCTGIAELPSKLKVGGNLHLRGCTGLTELPSGLMVGGILDLEDCTGLTKLPSGLKAGVILYLSKNLNEQVKIDAERLQKEGKIKEIKYV